MTPEQALQTLEETTAMVPLIRVDQATVMQALKLLKELIEKQKAVESQGKEKT